MRTTHYGVMPNPPHTPSHTPLPLYPTTSPAPANPCPGLPLPVPPPAHDCKPAALALPQIVRATSILLPALIALLSLCPTACPFSPSLFPAARLRHIRHPFPPRTTHHSRESLEETGAPSLSLGVIPHRKNRKNCVATGPPHNTFKPLTAQKGFCWFLQFSYRSRERGEGLSVDGYWVMVLSIGYRLQVKGHVSSLYQRQSSDGCCV